MATAPERVMNVSYVVFEGAPTLRELYSSWNEIHEPGPRTKLRRIDLKAADSSLPVPRKRSIAPSDIEDTPQPSPADASKAATTEEETQNVVTFGESYLPGTVSAAAVPPSFPFKLGDTTPIDQVQTMTERSLNIQLIAYVAQLDAIKEVVNGTKKRLEMLLSDQSGGFLTVVAWDEIAERIAHQARLADIVWLTNLRLRVDASGRMTASTSSGRTRFTVCYRCQRRTEADDALRPSLRLDFFPEVLHLKHLKSLAERTVLRGIA